MRPSEGQPCGGRTSVIIGGSGFTVSTYSLIRSTELNMASVCAIIRTVCFIWLPRPEQDDNARPSSDADIHEEAKLEITATIAMMKAAIMS